MWVAPESRRLGVGRDLIGTLEDWAQRQGIKVIKLMVTSVNDSAIAFYERLGYVMTGHTEPYPNDAAINEYEMSKQL